MSLVHLTSDMALLGFAAASVLYLLAVQHGGRQPWTAKAAFGLFTASTVAVTLALGAVVTQAPLPSLLDMSGLLLTGAIGWLATIGHLRFKMRLIGAFVAPLATLILLLHLFIAPSHGASAPLDGENSSVLVAAHVALAVIGEAFAILACAVSIFYLWQQSLLKKKLLDQLPTNLPAIDRVAALLKICLWAGFVFLTLGLLSGAIYTQLYAPAAELRLSAKVIWATAVWIWYLAILLAKNVFNRPSKRIAQMSLAGFVLLAFSYFGMGFFRSGGS